jgi:archaellin
VKPVTIGFALAGAAVAVLALIIPAAFAAVVMLNTEKSKEGGKSHEEQLSQIQ